MAHMLQNETVSFYVSGSEEEFTSMGFSAQVILAVRALCFHLGLKKPEINFTMHFHMPLALKQGLKER